MNQKESTQNLLNSYQNNFSHIYIEKNIENHPKTIEILNNFKNSKVILIDNFREVFNRSRQNFGLQKNSINLILAQKKFDFLYKGSPLCENFGEDNFYYSSNILNCIYNCEYCYLKGMYSSANIVVFVNIEDYFKDIMKHKDEKLYICISYDSDLLALEKVAGFTREWIKFAEKNPDVLIEVRTKSSNFESIADIKVPVNVILAWTLSPDEVIERYEHRTPSLNSRLQNIKLAISHGIKIRISIEPVIKIKDFENVYNKFIDRVFTNISSEYIRDVNVDVFRMKREHAKKIQKMDDMSDLFSSSLKNINGIITYEDEEYMKGFMIKKIEKYIDKSKIF